MSFRMWMTGLMAEYRFVSISSKPRMTMYTESKGRSEALVFIGGAVGVLFNEQIASRQLSVGQDDAAFGEL
jgi:hypothetical protein